MSASLKLILPGVLIAFCTVALPQSQTMGTNSDSATLQEHYDAAQQLQREGNLDKAAAQYRAFLADALGELAVSHAHLGEYSRASSLFDDALGLEPNSPALRLQYAAAALDIGDLPHAETLTRQFLADFPGDQVGSAHAHQILGRALLKMNRDQDARKELEAAVALDPTFENGYDLAVACLDLDDEKCAQQIFDEMQASFGDSAGIHMSFGRAYGDSDFQQQAVEEFKKVIAENPRFPGAYYALAAVLLATNNDAKTTQEVEIDLKKELAISPNDAMAYAALGKIAASERKYTAAERYLKKAVALNPKNPDAFLYLGQMYFDTGRASEAEASLRQSIRLTTDVSRNRYQVQKAHFLLGRLLMQQHKQEEARAEMEIVHTFLNKGLSEDKSRLAGLENTPGSAESTDTSPGSTEPYAGASVIADAEATRKLHDFEQRVTPAVADSYNNLGAIAATGKDYAGAMTYFQHAGEWVPSLDGLDYNLGRAAFSASRFGDAIMPLSRYLLSHQNDSSIRDALAISQFMTHNYSGCVDTLKRAQEGVASIPKMQYIYAESLVKTGQISSGRERFESLEMLHPEIAEVHRSLGEAFALQGASQNAIKELRTAIQLNENDPEAHYDLGSVELDSGDAAAAIPELESATRLLPNDPKFHQKLAHAYMVALRPADAEKELRIYNALAVSHVQPANTGTGSHETKAP